MLHVKLQIGRSSPSSKSKMIYYMLIFDLYLHVSVNFGVFVI